MPTAWFNWNELRIKVLWQMLFALRCQEPVWNSHCRYLHTGVFRIMANTQVIVANNAIYTQGRIANVAIYTVLVSF